MKNAKFSIIRLLLLRALNICEGLISICLFFAVSDAVLLKKPQSTLFNIFNVLGIIVNSFLIFNSRKIV